MLPFFAPEVNNDKSVEKEAFEKKFAHTFFFLDRSSYRPGQTLYFKGIVITQDVNTLKPKVFPDIAATIYLYNVNGEKVGFGGRDDPTHSDLITELSICRRTR